jgi:DNA-binding transcriptional LysR family regulator
MNIDLRTCRHVVALARLLSYTKAAREMCITQSALSRSIQGIEKQVKVKLFDRDRGGVHVTAVGRDFVERAAILLRDAENLGQMLQRGASAEVGEVAFGLGPLAAQALLPNLMPKMFVTKPELRTNAMVRNVDALLPALLKEEIELVVTIEHETMQSAPLKSEFLGWFPLSLIVRAAHPLLEGQHTDGQRKFPLLSPGHFSGINEWPASLRRYLSGPLHLIEDYGVALRITELSDAIWLSSTFAAMSEIRAGRLAEIRSPRQKPFQFKMMMYSLDKRSLSPGARMLAALFREQLGALSQAQASMRG